MKAHKLKQSIKNSSYKYILFSIFFVSTSLWRLICFFVSHCNLFSADIHHIGWGQSNQSFFRSLLLLVTGQAFEITFLTIVNVKDSYLI